MDLLIHTFVTLFIVIDPIGIGSIFMSLVRRIDKTTRRKMALRGTLIASIILFAFYLGGGQFLELLGIGVPAFRIAGGVLLFLLAIDMVFARQTGLRSTTIREQEEAEQKNDISVFPLAFPLIAGPGAITTVLLMAATPGSTTLFFGMGAILALVLSLTLLSLLFAARISHLLGETGANVVSRLLGLLLAALAVQYILDGLREGLVF